MSSVILIATVSLGERTIVGNGLAFICSVCRDSCPYSAIQRNNESVNSCVIKILWNLLSGNKFSKA